MIALDFMFLNLDNIGAILEFDFEQTFTGISLALKLSL